MARLWEDPPVPAGERPLLVVVGPTAAGKTALALRWAERLGTEIVSADSVQIFKGLDIGSAKPGPEELARVRHHAVSLLEPTERPSAGSWVEHVRPILAALHREGRVPIVCGGTGLYVRALLDGLAEVPPVPSAVRERVQARLGAEGPASLHRALALVDPEAASRIAPSDPQRITRALEVFEATGRPLSAWQRETTRPGDYQARVVGLLPELKGGLESAGPGSLMARIADRARRMLDEGLVDEVEGLLERYPEDCPGLSTLGYREVVEVVRGRAPMGGLEERLARAHRAYAKRQLTWFAKARVDLRIGPAAFAG